MYISVNYVHFHICILKGRDHFKYMIFLKLNLTQKNNVIMLILIACIIGPLNAADTQ